MFNAILARFLLITVLLGLVLLCAVAATPNQAATDILTQQHCQNYTVVWANWRLGNYHFKTERLYQCAKDWADV